MKKLFIITGEYSGDRHACDVVKELKKINPEIEIEAVGGENLANEGVKLFCDHSKMSAMGFNFKIILSHIFLGKRVADYIKNEFKPDMVLLVDYGGFNLNLSKVLSKYGIKLYYYIPPQIWASRKWRLKTIKKNISKLKKEELIEKVKLRNFLYSDKIFSSLLEKGDNIWINIDGNSLKYIVDNIFSP